MSAAAASLRLPLWLSARASSGPGYFWRTAPRSSCSLSQGNYYLWVRSYRTVCKVGHGLLASCRIAFPTTYRLEGTFWLDSATGPVPSISGPPSLCSGKEREPWLRRNAGTGRLYVR